MKNRWKHIFIPVLAMALCLSLAACGNSDDVAGEDWRTTGVVVGSGTITHDGESVDVLVTADPNSAAFYRDQEEQVLFDSVAFPETIEDISSSAFQISFDDQNGDEESDVLVEIGHEDMSNTTMLWLWAPHVVLPVGGVGEFNEIAVSLPADGVEIVVVAPLAVAVSRCGGEPHAGVEVVQLAVGIGDVLLGKIRNGVLRNVTDGVEVQLADAVMGIVAVLRDLPIAVAGGADCPLCGALGISGGEPLAAHPRGRHLGIRQ